MAAIKANRLEVLATKGGRKTNGFEWRCLRGKNILYFAVGYDTFQSAVKACKAMNGKLTKKLPIYHRDNLVE